MFLRVFSFLVLIIFFTSCDNFLFTKKTESAKDVSEKTLDTVVDFSSVDTSPSFKICSSIIEKQKKTICFRTTIHQKIGAELSKHSFSVKDSISEIVYVDLLINSKGNISLNKLQSSENIKIKLPKLDSLLKLSIKKLPIIYPAIKRGIPVNTEYSLPIRIELKE